MRPVRLVTANRCAQQPGPAAFGPPREQQAHARDVRTRGAADGRMHPPHDAGVARLEARHVRAPWLTRAQQAYTGRQHLRQERSERISGRSGGGRIAGRRADGRIVLVEAVDPRWARSRC